MVRKPSGQGECPGSNAVKAAPSGRCPTVSHVLERRRPRKSGSGRAERSGRHRLEHRRAGSSPHQPEPRIARRCRAIALEVSADNAIRGVDRDALRARLRFDVARRADGHGLRLDARVSPCRRPRQHELQGAKHQQEESNCQGTSNGHSVRTSESCRSGSHGAQTSYATKHQGFRAPVRNLDRPRFLDKAIPECFRGTGREFPSPRSDRLPTSPARRRPLDSREIPPHSPPSDAHSSHRCIAAVSSPCSSR